VVADDLDKPNGLAFSPGGTVLYIGDSGAIHGPGDFDPSRPRHVLAYDVLGARLGSRRLHCAVSPGFPDGIKVDPAGRLYAAVASGVLVHDLAGELIGEISIAGAVNLTFGGPDGNVLFVTTDTALWAAVLSVTP
jgi:gluconolactonase